MASQGSLDTASGAQRWRAKDPLTHEPSAAKASKRSLEFLGRATFLRNKRAAGPLKDLADIDALEPGRER